MLLKSCERSFIINDFWWFFAGVAIKPEKVGLTCKRTSKYSMITECQNIVVGQLDNWSSSSCDDIVYILTVTLLAWKFLSSVLYSLSGNKIQFTIWSGVAPKCTLRIVCTCIYDGKRWKQLFNVLYTFDMLCTWSFRFQLHWNVMYTILSLSIALEINMTNLEFPKLSRNSLAWIRS